MNNKGFTLIELIIVIVIIGIISVSIIPSLEKNSKEQSVKKVSPTYSLE